MNNIGKFKFSSFISFPLRVAPILTAAELLLVIAGALLPAYQALALASFIDASLLFFEQKDVVKTLALSAMHLFLFVILVNVLPTILNWINTAKTNRLQLPVKLLLLEKKSKLQYKYSEDKESLEIINRVMLDPIGMFAAGFQTIMSAVTLLLSTFSILTIVMTASPISGFAIIMVSIPLLIWSNKLGKQNYELDKEAKKVKRHYGYLEEVLLSRKFAYERKLFKYSDFVSKKYCDIFEKSFEKEAEIERKTYANMKSGSIITLLLFVGIVIILIPSVLSRTVSPGLFISLVNALFGLIQAMSWRLSTIMREQAKLREHTNDLNVFFSLDEKSGSDMEKVPICDFVFESIEFKNVSFGYPGSTKLVLDNCSFLLQKGKSYAFVGANGTGKSTIIKLLTGLYEEYNGDILLNGKNIKEYPYQFTKSLISVVFQDFFRYEIPVKDNLLLGNDLIKDTVKIEWALKQMGLTELIKKLPDGMNTRLGKVKENSVDLSGGEWQRLALARLLCSSAEISILDEPTASLDPIAENEIYNIFGKLNKEKFTIFITHRLGAAKNADEILVIEDGQVKEQGSHKLLIRQEDGLYRRMFETQKSWYL